jgi:hypothetical protein
VDGNVIRVLARVRAIGADTGSQARINEFFFKSGSQAFAESGSSFFMFRKIKNLAIYDRFFRHKCFYVKDLQSPEEKFPALQKKHSVCDIFFTLYINSLPEMSLKGAPIKIHLKNL